MAAALPWPVAYAPDRRGELIAPLRRERARARTAQVAGFTCLEPTVETCWPSEIRRLLPVAVAARLGESERAYSASWNGRCRCNIASSLHYVSARRRPAGGSE